MRIFVKALLRRGDAHLVQHRNGAFNRFGASDVAVPQQCFNNLLANGEHWVERRHRLLKNHRHSVAAQVLHFALGRANQLAAFKAD